jgi:hypothetical protein
MLLLLLLLLFHVGLYSTTLAPAHPLAMAINRVKYTSYLLFQQML